MEQEDSPEDSLVDSLEEQEALETLRTCLTSLVVDSEVLVDRVLQDFLVSAKILRYDTKK